MLPSNAWPPPLLRRPRGGKYVQSQAATASATVSTVGTTITSAPASSACWISRSLLYATRTPGTALAYGQVRHMRAAFPQSRWSCCISVQMKSYPAFAIAQYVAGSVALNSVPPVTLRPCCIFNLTGFQIFVPGGGSNAGPYFHEAGSNGP